MSARPPWQDAVLSQFERSVLSVVPLTVVEDRDHVVASEQIATELGRRGADLVSYDDPIAFRYLLESRYRSDPSSAFLVVRTERLTDIPWDILHAAERHGRRLVVTLADLFPGLRPDLLPELDRRHLDAVSLALARYHAMPSREGTIDYILQHAYGIVDSTINDEAALLSMLIELHYRHESLPPYAVDRLAKLLADGIPARAWPLEDLLTSPAALWGFIQERWPRHVAVVAGLPASDVPDAPEPADLPFDDPRVRVRIDSLFFEGFLEPTNIVPAETGDRVGIGFGVASPRHDPVQRLARLTDLVEDLVPDGLADHKQWQRFARTWGEWTASRIAVHRFDDPAQAAAVHAVQTRVQTTFEAWMRDHYGGLANLPYWPAPTMLHHVPDYVSHGRVTGQTVTRKAAVLVMDGMGFAQWHEIRPFLESLGTQMDEHGTFAWVPTLTVVSRQAIFAGEPPYAYAPSISTTRHEQRLWTRYWTQRGLRPQNVKYVFAQKLGSGDAIVRAFVDVIEHPATRVVGGVIGTVDQLAHAAKTGASGFHAALRDWLEQGVLARIVSAFLDADFDVYMTSDHGNVEVRGNGRPNTGSIASTNGERARVFASETLRDAVRHEMPDGLDWYPHGLPADYFPVLSPWDGAFVSEKFQLVSHGGITVDEVIVPFISLRKEL